MVTVCVVILVGVLVVEAGSLCFHNGWEGRAALGVLVSPGGDGGGCA